MAVMTRRFAAISTHPARTLVVLALIVVAALLALRLWGPGDGGGKAPPGNLEGSTVGGPFTLVDERGAPVTSDSYAGQWRLIYFGFTFCPDICPTDSAKLAEGLRQVEASDPALAARVQPLFVSVDPARDTPAALAEFTDQFHPRLVGLTGTEAQVAAALKTFRVYAEKQPGATPGAYLVDHSALYYLFDPNGRPVAFLTPMTAGPADVAAMLKAHVR